ncbi:TrmH family RNA methyltransferase [Candidatus Saccharibacteria bacterium]|nr:TrmH family RNA methyltransferase [Candidatus Saccharibacteria bacterium]
MDWRFDSVEEDTRNLIDELKGLSNEEVVSRLDVRRSALEVAIFNVSHDFNAGTIVRNANNFNVSKVHIVGRRKYNRRGAMCTDKYLSVLYWADISEFLADQKARGREVVAIENNVPARVSITTGDGELVEIDLPAVLPLGTKKFAPDTTLVFGSESDGISPELLSGCDDIREIESFGSTRSVNVGVASGIAMYEWARQCLIKAD